MVVVGWCEDQNKNLNVTESYEGLSGWGNLAVELLKDIEDKVVGELKVRELLVEGTSKDVGLARLLGKVVDGGGELEIANADKLLEEEVDKLNVLGLLIGDLLDDGSAVALHAEGLLAGASSDVGGGCALGAAGLDVGNLVKGLLGLDGLDDKLATDGDVLELAGNIKVAALGEVLAVDGGNVVADGNVGDAGLLRGGEEDRRKKRKR